MTVWTRLKEELDRAGRAAQGAFDEGKVRLELMRTRQLADKAAQAIGYAVFRAKQEGKEVDADTYSRLSAALSGHEAEAARQEESLKNMRDAKRAQAPAESAAEPPAAQ
jgi:hypothetical protein